MKTILISILSMLFLGCEQPKQQYLSESPEIEYTKALLNYYTTFNFAGIKSIYSDDVKIFENNLESYNKERLLATLKSIEDKIEYQRLEDSLEIEMVINNNDEKWVYARYLWKIKYKNSNKEVKIPVHTSWQFLDNKIITELSYYDSKYFHLR